MKQLSLWGFLFFLSFQAFSQLTLTNKAEEFYITNLGIFNADTKAMSEESITSGVFDSSFQPYTTNRHVIKAGSYWLKFSIKNNSSVQKAWLVEFFDFKINYLAFYTKNNLGTYDKIEGGDYLPFSYKTLSHKNFTFPLDLKKGEEKTYYVKVWSMREIALVMVVRTLKEFVGYALREYLILGVYYGIIFLVILFNLFLFFSSRDRAYLLYIYYVLSIGLFSLSVVDGMGFQYLWPHHPEFNKYAMSFSSLSMVISALLYARSFLLLKQKIPLLDKFIIGVIVLRIGVFFLEIGLDVLITRNPVWDWVTLTIPFLSGIISLVRGYSPARFYVIAFSFIFAGYLVFAISNQGIITSNFLSVYAINFAVVAEIILLSMALAERLKTFKLENEKAQKDRIDQLIQNENLQKKVIEQLQENDVLKERVNQELELKVKERTKELIAAREHIEQINLLLQTDNQNLQLNVKSLHKDRVMQKLVSFDEFKNIYPDEKACFDFLENLKWSNGFTCKQCKHIKFAKGNMPYSRRCSKCGYIESVMGGTIFSRLKFPLLKAFYMVFLVHNNPKVTSEELSQVLELRKQTCWTFKKKVLLAKKEVKTGKKNPDGWSNLILIPLILWKN